MMPLRKEVWLVPVSEQELLHSRILDLGAPGSSTLHSPRRGDGLKYPNADEGSADSDSVHGP